MFIAKSIQQRHTLVFSNDSAPLAKVTDPVIRLYTCLAHGLCATKRKIWRTTK